MSDNPHYDKGLEVDSLTFEILGGTVKKLIEKVARQVGGFYFQLG